jgi:polyhydroxyalkanoate synthesis repressor PhaR
MTKQQTSGIIIIKKYPNRRLYNTQTSCYIVLKDLFDMVRRKELFEVRDSKSGKDLTRFVLTQVMLEQELSGHNLLSINFLSGLIAMCGQEEKEDILNLYLTGAIEYLLNHNSDHNDKFILQDAKALKDKLQQLTAGDKKR